VLRFFRRKPAPKPKRRRVVKKPRKPKATPRRRGPPSRGEAIGAFFEPRAVLVVGASGIRAEPTQEFFRPTVENMLRFYRGKTHVVDLSGRLEGASRDLRKVRGKAELAILTLPQGPALKNVKRLVDARVRAVIAAPRYEQGVREELEAAVKRGVRVLGPNAAMGTLNTRNGLCASFERGLMPKQGGIAIISQSNSVGAAILDSACFRGIGVSKFVSTGDAVDVNEAELIDYLSRDVNTRVICVGIREVREGRGFVEAVRRAAEKKPVVVLKGGVVGEQDKIYDAAIKQALAIRVRDVEELLGVAEALAKQPLMLGDRVAIISNASGPAILVADAIHREGLILAKLSEKTAKAMAHKYPGISVVNPLELGVGAEAKCYGFTLEQVLADPGVDGVVVITALKSRPLEPDDARVVAEVAKKFKKPVVGVAMGGEDHILVHDALKDMSVPVYDLAEKAVCALKALRRYGQIRWRVGG